MISRSFVYGVRRAIEDSVREMLEGLIFAFTVETILMVSRTVLELVNAPTDALGLMGASLALVAVAAEVTSALELLERMQFWSTGYLAGYIVTGAVKQALGMRVDLLNGFVILFGLLVLVFRAFRILLHEEG